MSGELLDGPAGTGKTLGVLAYTMYQMGYTQEEIDAVLAEIRGDDEL